MSDTAEITDDDVIKFIEDNHVHPGDYNRIFVKDPETGEMTLLGLDITDTERIVPLALRTTDDRVLVLRVKSGMPPDYRPEWIGLHGPFDQAGLDAFVAEFLAKPSSKS